MNRYGAIALAVGVAVVVFGGALFLCSESGNGETFQQQALTLPGRTLVSAAQTISSTWLDLGSEMGVEDAQNVALYASVTISDSQNVRFRALGKHRAATTEYVMTILTVSASDVKAEDRYVELNDDADQNVAVVWELDRVFPLVQFQVSAGTVGTTAGQIETAYAVIGQ